MKNVSLLSAPRQLLGLTPARSQQIADGLAVLVVTALPWSTSITSIMVVLWMISLVPLIDRDRAVSVLLKPQCMIPVALVALGLIGMLWSDAAWATRFYAFSSNLKLLAIPLFVYQFSRSDKAMWILAAFIGSCFLLMILSWIITVKPAFALKREFDYGVPVKNYIDQSQEFAFCAIVALWPAAHVLKSKRYVLAALLLGVSISFIANLVFVNVSRTALVTIPFLIVLFLMVHLSLRNMLAVIAVMIALAVGLGSLSPLVRAKATSIYNDYNRYFGGNVQSSGGQRMEFWRKSVGFIAAAPVIGHGTGSIYSQFEKAPQATTGPAPEAVSNPHNQILYAAIQWGGLGVIVVLLMWCVHLVPFLTSGFAQGAGLLIVVQNIVGSLFNSHLTDFTPGWMYVIGVGVAFGTILNRVDHRQTDLGTQLK